MANYTPNDALGLTIGHIRQMTLTDAIKAALCDQVNSMIWCHRPWRWSLGALTAVGMSNNVQDYSMDAANSDFYRLIRPIVTRTDTTPDLYRELDPVESLPPDLVHTVSFDAMQCVSWEPTISKLRLEAAASVPTGVTLTLGGDYQKVPTKITSSTLGTSLTQPDHYFSVWVEGLLYRLFKYAADDRAGTVVVTKDGRRQYTGQLGVFMAMLQEMTEQEDYGNAQAQRYPTEPLGIGRGSTGFIFP